MITELLPMHIVGLLTDKIETVGVHGPIKILGQLPEYSGTNEGGVYKVFVLKVRVTFDPLDVGSVPKYVTLILVAGEVASLKILKLPPVKN